MKIGMTYDLREEYLAMGYTREETAEFDGIETIEAVDRALHIMGFETDRIGNARNLVNRLATGHRWDLVFNIAEGLYGSGREALVPALLDHYLIPYVFSGPLVMALTLDKSLAKLVVREAGVATPDYFIVRKPEDIVLISLPYPLFAKPLAEGTGKGISGSSVIRSPRQLKQVCAGLLERFRQPVLVETYLDGREFTAGIVGTGVDARCIGVMEIVLNRHAEKGVYSYANKEEWEKRVRYTLPDPEAEKIVKEAALKVWLAIGGEDGGRVDIRFDRQGIPHFLEVNPLAGIHPTHSDLPILARLNGIDYHTLMNMIMESALKKVKTTACEKSADSVQ